MKAMVPNIHLVLEYVAFFVAFQYYLFLRKNSNDTIRELLTFLSTFKID